MTLHLQVEVGQQRFLIDCQTIDKVLSARALLSGKSNSEKSSGLYVHEGFAHYVVDMRRKIFGHPTSLYLNSRILTFKSELSIDKVFLFEKVVDLYRGEYNPGREGEKAKVIIDGFVYHVLGMQEIAQGVRQDHYYA